jgi:iron(II)-dependent oxidoreductase
LREVNTSQALAAGLRDSREYTLQLYAHLTPAQRCVPYRRTINPPAWELAHVAWFHEWWCLRRRADREPLPSRFLPDADAILDSARIAHALRWELPQLTWDRVHDYLRRVHEAQLEALERDAPEDLYFHRLALYHEDMHAEALLMTLQTLGLPEPPRAEPPLPPPSPAPVRAREIEFAGGTFEMGSRPGADFVFDNEAAPHHRRVEPFALSTCTVTQGEFRGFVEAGGYGDERWWTDDGWAWCTQNRAGHPITWRRDGAFWEVRRFDRWEALVEDRAMVHVNAHEAEACCRFFGRRLPSEAEWEFAARGAPVTANRFAWGDALLPKGAVNLDEHFGRPVASAALPSADSAGGLRQMLGNVWEWTSTPFSPYPGFEPGPYREYSAPWFGNHRVLRGGCFATRQRLVHNRWRNFYTPDRSDVFAGFRMARDLPA